MKKGSLQHACRRFHGDRVLHVLTCWTPSGGARLGCCKHVMHLSVRASLQGLLWSARMRIVLERQKQGCEPIRNGLISGVGSEVYVHGVGSSGQEPVCQL